MNQRGEPDGAEVSGAACKLPDPVLMWEFECNNCHAKFETPVPRGPREERAIKCPECSSRDIKRLNEGKMSPTACGG
ncbi:MAG: hypothetical protein JRJ29_17625 [Deltaproteobacteria bacterium]|nr:hypothetical protein [Deltaproteobacteria bacterium]